MNEFHIKSWFYWRKYLGVKAKICKYNSFIISNYRVCVDCLFAHFLCHELKCGVMAWIYSNTWSKSHWKKIIRIFALCKILFYSKSTPQREVSPLQYMRRLWLEGVRFLTWKVNFVLQRILTAKIFSKWFVILLFWYELILNRQFQRNYQTIQTFAFPVHTYPPARIIDQVRCNLKE